jgi:hypothetical protein
VPWGYIARASLLIVIFAVALVVFVELLSLIPGASALSKLVTLGLPLALAWLVAAGIGQNFMPAKRSLALATVCLLVASPLAYYKPWERGWQPGGGQVPENVPEGYVAFRFVSSFTYVSSEGNQPITNVELQLPWPYIDAYENGRPCPRPVGLDNWLRKTNLYVGMVETENINEFVREVWKIENAGLGIYTLENAVWAVNFPPPGLPYIQTGFASLKLYYGDQLEWKDNQVIGLFGSRTTVPTITAYLEDWRDYTTFQKITVNLSDMRPGETISIEGTFIVAEENEDEVRLDDWIASGIDRVYWKTDQENAPEINAYWSSGDITAMATSQLEKLVNGNFTLVVKYKKTWVDTAGGIYHSGLIDGEITR